MADARSYLASHGVEQKLSDAVAAVLKTRPEDPLPEIAKMLSGVTKNYLATVGNTPLVKLDACLPPEAKHATVLAKLEMNNPGGSLKDRIAIHMIEKAEKAGKIKPGDTLVDISSGNTGIGEALVAAAKGYRCIIVMPGVPPMYERYLICRQLGADVHLCNAAHGPAAMMAYSKELGEKPNHFYLQQFYNTDNPETHTLTTGPEIWAQTGGKVDYFIHGIGTGGCVQGCGEFLKGKDPNIKVIAIEPAEARVHVGQPMGKHGILGLASGLHSPFIAGADLPKEQWDDKPRGVIDEWGSVATPDCVKYANEAAKKEGMLIGPSAGAALKMAIDVASRPESAGKTIVVIFASHAIRYTKHPLWAAGTAEAAKALPVPPIMDKEKPLLLWDSSNQPAE